jgi:hypothetical protein
MYTRLLCVRAWACGCSAFLLSLAFAQRVHAAEEVYSQDAVEAAYLVRFAGYVEWPEHSLAGHPFIIAVSGAHGVAQELRRLLPAHPIHGETAQVREVSRVQDVGSAQILYVGNGHSEFLRAFAAGGTRFVLLVTADEQGLELGSVLNFVIVDKRVRFEVSLTAAERMELKISSDLLSVAIRVRGGHRQSDHMCIPFSLFEDSDGQCGIRQAHRIQMPRAGNGEQAERQSDVGSKKFFDVS